MVVAYRADKLHIPPMQGANSDEGRIKMWAVSALDFAIRIL